MGALTKLKDRYSETEIDGEIIIMRLDNGELLSLTDTGAAIWRLIDGVRDRGQLVAALNRQFDISSQDVGAQVDDFLTALRQAGLVASV